MSRPTPDPSKGYDGLNQQSAGENNMTGLQANQLNPTLNAIVSLWADPDKNERPEQMTECGLWAWPEPNGVKHIYYFDGQRDIELFRISADSVASLPFLDIPLASLFKTGIVRLSEEVEESDAQSGLLAATIGSVRKVWGKAVAAYNAAVTDATTAVKGRVMLNDTVTSANSAQAATARAVKQAYDTAVYGLSPATTAQSGIVRLNDTVTSASTTEAATANAVRIAYWRASIAAPMPHFGQGPGQLGEASYTPAGYTVLPPGGTWIYLLSRNGSLSWGTAAGGSVVAERFASVTAVAWRIA